MSRARHWAVMAIAVGALAGTAWADAGNTMNGTSLNGAAMDGDQLDQKTLDGNPASVLMPDGTWYWNVSLSGTDFVSIGSGGVQMAKGRELIGGRLFGTSVAGMPVELLIGDVQTAPPPDPTRSGNPNADVSLYTVYQRGTAMSWQWVCVGSDCTWQFTDWQPVCGVNPDSTPVKAIPLGWRWNAYSGARVGPGVTFACQGAALAKCAQNLGYKPWLAGLADYHQACTRMLRADYCGVGISMTTDGTWINATDSLGLLTPVTQGSWLWEANWGPDGATCVSAERHNELSNFLLFSACNGNIPPACVPSNAWAPGDLMKDWCDDAATGTCRPLQAP